MRSPCGIDGVSGIIWANLNEDLSLSFANDLTSTGGTVNLDIFSSFTDNVGEEFEVTGSVTGVPEPLTLLGASFAVAFGFKFKNYQQH